MINSRIRGTFLTLVSTGLTFAAFYFLFEYQQYVQLDSLFWASIVTSALLIHELGHWVTSEYFGVPSYALLSPIYSHTRPLAGSEYKLRHLGHLKQASIGLAGVSANGAVLVGAIAYSIAFSNAPNEAFYVAVVHAAVMLPSLLPIYGTDNIKVTKLLFFGHQKKLDLFFVSAGYMLVIWVGLLLALPLLSTTSLQMLVGATLVGIPMWFTAIQVFASKDERGAVPEEMSKQARRGVLTCTLMLLFLSQSTALLSAHVLF